MFSDCVRTFYLKDKSLLLTCIVYSAFCSQSISLRSISCFPLTPVLLFHFLPMNGKTKITLLKCMALQGRAFCVTASEKQERCWLKGTLGHLQFQGLMGLGPWIQTQLIT